MRGKIGFRRHRHHLIQRLGGFFKSLVDLHASFRKLAHCSRMGGRCNGYFLCRLADTNPPSTQLFLIIFLYMVQWPGVWIPMTDRNWAAKSPQKLDGRRTSVARAELVTASRKLQKRAPHQQTDCGWDKFAKGNIRVSLPYFTTVT